MSEARAVGNDEQREAAGPELCIALITPLGAPTDHLVAMLESELRTYNYSSEPIRLSDLLAARYEGEIPQYRDLRTAKLVELGNELCKELSDRSAVARLGIEEIVHRRADNPYSRRRAWVIRSLKRPEEVTLLRHTYGDAFYSVAIYSEESMRRVRLQAAIKASRSSCANDRAGSLANEMIARDENQAVTASEHDYGQNVLKTFPMADVIISGDDPMEQERQVRRFVRVLFGENIVPSSSEHAMYLADGTAAISSSLSRKVGACMATERGEIVAVGVNEAPKAGGGQYTGESIGGRDADIGNDYSELTVHDLAASTVLALAADGWLSEEKAGKAEIDPDGLADEAIALLEVQKSPLMSLLEFQRPVHAEMSAILDAGRRGVSPKGAYLYCTTYPCHLCMKEIIAAGVWKVVYIEPYPKSRSVAMYGDALAIGKSIHDSQSTEIASVSVDPFIGVSPRAYRRLFVEQQYRRKDSRGEVVRQPLNTALPKAGYLRPLLSVSEREGIAILPLVPLDENEEMEQ